jgi:nucleoside-diphosphate-sugar epimerase
MKLLVTGGAGYIGSTLVPMLLEHGHHVAVFDALRHGIGPILPLFRDPRFSFVRGDVRDRQALADFARDADAFVHLAAISGYPACEQAPDEARSTNVEGTRNVAAVACCGASSAAGRPVVFASTGSCYGAVTDGLCTEETPLRPLSVYGQTKAEAEQVMLGQCDAIVLRLATAYGLSPRLRLDLLVNDFVHRALRERRLTVYEGHFRRSFLHVRDIARAILLALETSQSMTGRVFNVGDPRQNCTKLELCQIIQKVIPGVEIDASASGRDADRRDYAVSFERIWALGFEATVSLEEGIRELAAVLRWM